MVVKQKIARVWVITESSAVPHDVVAIRLDPHSVLLTSPCGIETSIDYANFIGVDITFQHVKNVHPYWVTCGHMMLPSNVPDTHVASQIAWHERKLEQLKERAKS